MTGEKTEDEATHQVSADLMEGEISILREIAHKNQMSIGELIGGMVTLRYLRPQTHQISKYFREIDEVFSPTPAKK